MTSESPNPESPEMAAPEPPAPPARSGRRIASVALGLSAIVTVAALAMTQGRTSSPRIVDRGGRAAPAFTLENLQRGQPPVALEKLRGKPVILNFWASWCGPCRKEMPAFEAVHESLGDKVTFVGIDSKDFRDSALEFVQKTGVRYASGFDSAGNVAASYGVIGMPSTFFISEDGSVLDSRTGEINRDELEETISRLYGIS